jgi:hypothetical protein
MADEGPAWWARYPDFARHYGPEGMLDRCMATETGREILQTFGSLEFYDEKMSPDLIGFTAAGTFASCCSNTATPGYRSSSRISRCLFRDACGGLSLAIWWPPLSMRHWDRERRRDQIRRKLAASGPVMPARLSTVACTKISLPPWSDPMCQILSRRCTT